MKKSLYVEMEKELWKPLKELELKPGVSVYLRGIKVTKSHGFVGANIIAKWKKNIEDGLLKKHGLSSVIFPN